MEWTNNVTDGHRDKAICRCLGCGKFCNSRTLAQGDSLCVNCSASWQTYQEPRSVALEESGAAVELVRDYSMMKEIASSPCPANCGGFSNGSIDHTNEGIATGGTSQREIGLCARCWAAEGTSILYNSPVCDECFRQAKEKREPIKGTKKRYQPPTPSLQPGKRLTRVCDTCRRKRKRCQHRRIVDENHSDADPRPRRGKKRNFRSSVSMNSPSPTNAEAEEGESDVDVTPKQETVQSPRRQSARQAQKRMDEMMEVCLSPPSSFTSLLEVVNSELERESPRQTQQQVIYDTMPAPESDNENLPLAIQDSFNLVHAREMARTVCEIQDKMADINDTIQVLKSRLDGWMRRSYNELCA
ncbi:hypothetical protein AAP_04093 [Ascosphaera apis ARSEF 7405]|uniref:Uncharacterized protein n=1 Tax=Ascosphaera apis ARSEF 7405 TaxID=392613 RepID=A0A162I8S6_9EURO|nr:hypothetical protein AAP_04093 [Ascosphaera apis ARSEF 7405]